MTEKQINPNFGEIFPKCIIELNIKFPEYGNSWMTGSSEYWRQRISNEVEEYQKSMSLPSSKRKLLNLINMCAMAYENLDKGRMEY